jgi:hypothetical protein
VPWASDRRPASQRSRLPTPIAAKARAVPVNERLGTDDGKNLTDRRKPAVKHDQEPAIIVRKPDTALEPAPQNNQLMPKHRVLSLKPHLRLDWRGQDSQEEKQKPDHSASLGDSITSSTWMRSSVHTDHDVWMILTGLQPNPTAVRSGLLRRYIGCMRTCLLHTSCEGA